MKKKFLLFLVVASVVGLSGCTPQEAAKHYGGSMNIELEPNTKLEGITWKDNSLWYLTRPMREDDVAEMHTFQESSSWGVFEGTVTVIEKKTK